MAFCSQCGAHLTEGARFCTNCGAAVVENTAHINRKQVFEGKIHKCPNCGEVIKPFTAVCPSCGHVFRGTDPSNTVKTLQLKLENIEGLRKEPKNTFFFMPTMDMYRMSSVDAQKVSLIRNFAIPNNKEEIYEFVILAASNIDTSGEYTNGYLPGEQAAARALTSAWEAKLDQAYEKARLSFGQDTEFDEIRIIYNSKKRDLRLSKLKRTLITIGLIVGFIALMMGLCGYLSKSINSTIERSRAAEESLNAIVDEVMVDVSEGDYDSALVKANSIRYDKTLSSDKATQWDERREELIEMIKEKKMEEGK